MSVIIFVLYLYVIIFPFISCISYIPYIYTVSQRAEVSVTLTVIALCL